MVKIRDIMNWKNNKELKIGVFVIVVLCASFLVINYLRNGDIFNREYEITAEYEDLQGLLPSAPVIYRGYRAGQVAGIEYDKESGMFSVTCSVSRDFTFPDDSRLVITGTDIMGTKGLKVVPGQSETAVPDGGRLEGGAEPDMIASLAGSVTSLASKLENTLDSLDAVVGNVNRLFGEKNRVSVERTLEHLEKTASNVEALSDAIGGKSEEFAAFAESLNSLAANLDSTLNMAGNAVSDIAEITAAIDPQEVASVLSSFRSLLGSIQDPDGSLGLLMKDDSLYRSLDSLLTDVNSLVKKIEENPKKYIRISVF